MKRIILTLALLLPAISLASTQIPGKAQDHPIALVGGTIHTVSGAVIDNGTVVFNNGKITAVGANVTIPDNAERVDVAGRHVYPGLIDSYSQIGLTEIGEVRATNDYSETGDINPNVRAEVAVNPESEIIPVTRSNGILAALAVPRSGVLSGQSALLDLDGWTWEDMTLKAPVAMHMNWPRMVPFTAWWMRQTEEEQAKQRDEQLAKIEQTFADARAYKTAVDAARAGSATMPRHDTRWEAMIPVLNGDVPLVISADGIMQIQAAVAFGEREKVKVIILGGYDAPLCTDLLVRNHVPVIVSQTLRNPRRRGDDYDASFTVPMKLREAGVPFCIAGGGGASNERNLPYNAAMAAAFGLSPDEALKSITLYPAQILGIANRIGSIEMGKDASLIVTNGDILDIPTHVELAYIQGKHIDLSDKQKLLYLKYKEKYDRMKGK